MGDTVSPTGTGIHVNLFSCIDGVLNQVLVSHHAKLRGVDVLQSHVLGVVILQVSRI